jgi:hypothetical protein
MANNLRGKIVLIKRKLELIEKRLYIGLGWILVFLSSVLIFTFLYNCYEAITGKDTLKRSDGIGFLVSIVLLLIGILSILYWKREKPL